jgi:hypothetical protein
VSRRPHGVGGFFRAAIDRDRSFIASVDHDLPVLIDWLGSGESYGLVVGEGVVGGGVVVVGGGVVVGGLVVGGSVLGSVVVGAGAGGCGAGGWGAGGCGWAGGAT